MCPLKCAEKTIVIGSIQNLPRNYIIAKMAATIRQEQVASKPEGKQCEWCSSSDLCTPCSVCLSFVCNNCSLPSSLHHSLCTSGVPSSRKASSHACFSSAEEKYISFFSDDDALERLYGEVSEENRKNIVVKSINYGTLPVMEYTISNALPGNVEFAFHVYGESSPLRPFSCNNYLGRHSEPTQILRVAALMKSVVQRATKSCTSLGQELVNCVKRLLPITKESNGKVYRVIGSPIGYQFFAFHLIWLAKQQLFIIYHQLYPFISKIQFTQLLLMEKLLKQEMSWRESYRAAQTSGPLQSDSADVFTKGSFHNRWVALMRGLHCALGALSEAVDVVEEGVCEIRNLFQDYVYLTTLSPLHREVEVPNITLRSFLKTENDTLNVFHSAMTSLLEDVMLLGTVSSRTVVESMTYLLEAGGGDIANELVQLQQNTMPVQLQCLYVLWGNHRLHYLITSGIVAKTVLHASLLTSSIIGLLETCYPSPSKPYDPLGESLLTCFTSVSETQPLHGLWTLLPCFHEDLKAQKADALVALQGACEVSCYASSYLDHFEVQGNVGLPPALSCCPNSAIKIFECMKKVLAVPYKHLAVDGRRIPWLLDCDQFLESYIRVDLCLYFFYLLFDEDGFPETALFNRSVKRPSALDVTLPCVSLDESFWSELDGEQDVDEGTVAAAQFETFLSSVEEANETHTYGAIDSHDHAEDDGSQLEVPETLKEAVKAYRTFFLSSWRSESSMFSKLTWRVGGFRRIFAPFYRIHFQVNGRLKRFLFNAHTGECAVTAEESPSFFSRLGF